MLKLVSLNKSFTAGEVRTTALDRVSLEIAAGEYVAVTGPSGCGKSTLLSVLGMFETGDSGQYWFDGQDIAGWSEMKLNELRRGRIGFIFQDFNLLEELSVAENVELALSHANVPRQQRRARVAAMLDKLGVGHRAGHRPSQLSGGQQQRVAIARARVAAMLDKLGVGHRAGHRPSQLSGGQQQRVAIARALVARPALLLADEPTGNLDTAHGNEVMRLLRQINDEGTTVVMVTHSPGHAAQAGRTVRLLDGRIVADAVAPSAAPSATAALAQVAP
ncbi:ABC transporter ATP-binding protein [Massilia sp. YIM B02443]|uniref:ABC transporter ATP-binding protein n=1 Tax=Massilia sp. YIM B02443 TaxID=3050127 RepID=UPI0025B6E865|nr:ABC transporter ATP-binding protein [Massilia sp. YIM B02443]MDN4037719.1 ABC transporter ATP-binding protein [Massilia sp. YIM B02443]